MQHQLHSVSDEVPVMQGPVGTGQSSLLPRTPKSIMKRKTAFRPNIQGDVALTTAQA